MEETGDRKSNARIGIIAVAVLVAVPLAIWLVTRALGGDTHGVVVDKTNGYVRCPQQRRADRPPGKCTFHECLRIEYRTDDNRTKGVCVTRERYDQTKIGDQFSE